MADLYFGKEVDSAIVSFQKAETELDKHAVFTNTIYPAFDKLIKFHYYRLPADRDPEAIHACMCFLYEQIGKFDIEKHERGFPYFNMVAKNWFIAKYKKDKKYKKDHKNIEIVSDLGSLDERDDNHNFMDEDKHEKYENIEFVNIFKEQLPKWREKFSKPQEKEFVDALVLLFENANNIDIYNKKAIFFYLKEITDMNSKQIAININKISRKISSLRKKYNKGNI